MDTDPERANPERLRLGAALGPSHVEIREDDAAELLMECVDVAAVVGVIKGQFPLGAVQLHPDPPEISWRRFRAHGVGRPALVFAGEVVDVPESGAGIMVESPVGASVGPGHAHPPVGEPAQVHFPGVEAFGEAAGSQDAGGGGEALRVFHGEFVAVVGDAGEVLGHREPAGSRVGVQAEWDWSGMGMVL